MIIALMCMCLTSLAASAQTPDNCYIIGSDNVWNINTAAATLTETSDGVFSGEVTFTSNYFAIFTALGDWNSNRYGGEYNGDQVAINTAKTIQSVTDGSLYASATGTYTVTVDFNKMTVLLYSDTYVVEIPTTVYVVGHDGNWTTNSSSLTLTKTSDGIFSGEMTVTDSDGGYGYFCIASQLTDNADDWTTFNTHRYGPSGDQELTSGVATEMAYQDNASWKIAAGTYKLVVDFNENTITATSDSSTGITTVKAENDADSYYSLGGYILDKAPQNGVYILNGKKYIAK